MKDFIKTVLGILLFVCVAVAAIVGVHKILQKPSVILTDSLCKPPCWYGIHPGQEGPANIYSKLSAIKEVDPDSLIIETNRDYEISDIHWNFQSPAPDGTGAIYFSDDRVTAISITTLNSLKLKELFEILGEPQNFWAETGQREYGEYVRVYLFYPAQGYLADALIDIEDGAGQVTLKESTPVFQVTYYDAAKYADLLETRILIDTPVNARSGSLVPWTGYGTISFVN